MSFKITPCSLIKPLVTVIQKEIDAINLVLTWLRKDYQVVYTWECVLNTTEVDVRYKDYIKQQYAMAGWGNNNW